MKRPIGLIFSAIVLSLAALFLLLMTALTVLAGIFVGHQQSTAAAPHFVIYLMLATGVFYIALAVWAILTVVGILRLRSWARYSILVIGGGLAVFGVFATALNTLFSHTMLPTLQAQQPAANSHLMALVLLFVSAIYLLIAAVGIWWLIYFNLRSIRETFLNQAMLLPSPGSASGRFSQAPTAIKIIGGLLLVSTVCCLLCAFLPFPAFLLGFILPPAANHVLFSAFAIITALAGYGLLRLKESARLLTIAFLIVGCCNLALAVLPWYRAQLRLYLTQLIPYMPTVSGQPQVSLTYTGTLILTSYLWCLIVYGIVFWLLHRHRAAFRTPAPPPPLTREP